MYNVGHNILDVKDKVYCRVGVERQPSVYGAKYQYPRTDECKRNTENRVNESNGIRVTTKQGTMGVAKSRIEENQCAAGD